MAFRARKVFGISRNGPQASILRHSMYHHHINRAIYHVVKLIVDLMLIPYLWFGMSDSSTTQCDVISSFCRHVLRWRDNRRLGPFGFRWLYFSWRGWNKMMKQHLLQEKLIPCATIKKIRNIHLRIIIAMAKVWASFKNSGSNYSKGEGTGVSELALPHWLNPVSSFMINCCIDYHKDWRFLMNVSWAHTRRACRIFIILWVWILRLTSILHEDNCQFWS